MDFLYLKAIHIVFVVSWFAALFYIVRLFIYTTEAQEKTGEVKQAITQQLLVMQHKLFAIIGWPAMIGTYIFGGWMLLSNWEYYIAQNWMLLKLLSVLLLTLYHVYCQKLITEQKQGTFSLSSFKLRLLNELATIFLVAIVFLVVIKSTAGLLYGVGGLLVFAFTLMLAVFLYRKARLKNNNQTK